MRLMLQENALDPSHASYVHNLVSHMFQAPPCYKCRTEPPHQDSACQFA